MNKKLAMLLIPLLLVPMASFAYAHYTDNVEKRYKIHVGSVVANVTYFHVDKLKTVDTNCNGYIWDDELNITIFEDPATCTWYVLIACNPIPPSFELDTTMMIHNVGKLPWVAYWDIYLYNMSACDPYGCFDGWDEDDFTELSIYQGAEIDRVTFRGIYGWYIQNGLMYNIEFSKNGMPVSPTGETYHPCENLTIAQNVTLIQPPKPSVTDPLGVSSADWQKNIQCHWFLIWVKIVVQNETPIEYSSATWEDGEWTSFGNIPRD
jgi:hypothetical protein